MKKILLGVLILFASLSAFAQQRTGYFVDSYLYNHQMNPAFAPGQGYIGIPVLSNLGANINSNIGAENILYPLSNGRVGLFLHPEVTSEKFLAGLSEINFINGAVDLGIVNVGWFTKRGSFWSIDIGANVTFRSTLPKDFFRFLKTFGSNTTDVFRMDNVGVAMDAYSYASVGYSTPLDNLVEGLRIGGKLKFLAGMINMSAQYDELQLSMNEEKWEIVGKGSGHILGGGVDFSFDPETGILNGVFPNLKNFGLAGIGGALDFGVQYRISEGCAVDGLRFSLSVTDLGFISYFKDKATYVTSDGSVDFGGFESFIESEESIEDQFKNLTDRAMSIVTFRKSELESDKILRLTTKFYAGVDYSFLKDKMNVGLLYVGHFSPIRNHHEMMVSFDYAPTEWFDVALSYSYMNTRTSIGWLLTFTPGKGLNVLLGSDYTAFRYSPQGIPVNKAFLGVNLGVSVPIGEKR